MRLANLCSPQKRAFAKKLKSNPTKAEAFFYSRTRRRAFGPRFRRQVVIRGYIVDFWIPKFKLVIEIDGPYHDPEDDAIRDGHLSELGIKTIRFTNSQVLDHFDDVASPVLNHLLSPEFSAYS